MVTANDLMTETRLAEGRNLQFHVDSQKQDLDGLESKTYGQGKPPQKDKLKGKSSSNHLHLLLIDNFIGTEFIFNELFYARILH